MARHLATARWIGGLLTLIPSGLPAQNLIRNPGFEDAGPAGTIAAWSVNPSWYIDPKEKGLAAVSADPEVFQGMGRRSLKMDGQGKRGLAQQSLAGRFAPGQRLRLSGWMKFENIRPAVGRISVSFHGQNGKWLGQRDITTDWRVLILWKVFREVAKVIDEFSRKRVRQIARPLIDNRVRSADKPSPHRLEMLPNQGQASNRALASCALIVAGRLREGSRRVDDLKDW